MGNRGLLVIISGPAGTGKSSVINELFRRRDKLFFSVSATTRAPRKGEVPGESYHFITREKFDEMLAKDEFLEHATYVSNSYGSPRAPVEEKLAEGYDVIMDIEVQGAKQVKEKMPEAITVFLAPPSFEELERRLRGRSTETEETIVKRLQQAQRELPELRRYDYTVVNDQVDRAAGELLTIIEKAKTERN